jgi:glycerol kinase
MDAALAIDQGTTATKAFSLGRDGEFTALLSREHRQLRPRPGWVEQDPEELLANIRAGIAAAETSRRPPAAVGLANQGETVVAWDRASGRPIANAIVWQDTRTQSEVERLRSAGAEALTLERAGLPLDAYFSATKLRWMLDHVPEARALLARGSLGLGTSDSFFIHRLTGRYVTDSTTASRTSLMNLASRQWDPELCACFGVPVEALPEIGPTAGPIGEIRTPAGRALPLTASLVDQQAALYGHGCRAPGQVKITFGTGAFALTLTGPTPTRDRESGLLPTVAWALPGEPASYALDGGVYDAGSAIDWARGLGLFADYSEIDGFDGPLALERGLVFVPALSGLACPHWDRRAAGLWLGLGHDTGRRDLVRAILEGVALRAAEVVEAMAARVAVQPSVSIDGGLSRNGYFRQVLAAALGRTITVPAMAELTGLGVAQLTLQGAGLTLAGTVPPVAPPQAHCAPDTPLSAALHERFRDAVRRCRAWR